MPSAHHRAAPPVAAGRRLAAGPRPTNPQPARRLRAVPRRPARRAGLVRLQKSRPPAAHRRVGSARQPRSRHRPHHPAAEAELRSRRVRPREAGRDGLWLRLRLQITRDSTQRTRSGVLRTHNETLASVSSKMRWSAIDEHPRMLFSSLIGASVIYTVAGKKGWQNHLQKTADTSARTC